MLTLQYLTFQELLMVEKHKIKSKKMWNYSRLRIGIFQNTNKCNKLYSMLALHIVCNYRKDYTTNNLKI